MSQLLLDTHVWAWTFNDFENLTDTSRAAIETADAVYVSPISVYEIAQKVRLGKWPAMAGIAPRLSAVLVEQGIATAPLTAEIALHAASRDWAHRDPFDRLLASTAELLDLTFVTKDSVFDRLPALRCLW